MSPISIYKKQLQKASRALARDQSQLLDIESQIQELQKKKSEITRQIEEDISNVVTKGMLYFDSEKRTQLLDDAAQLSYSQMKIEKIRCMDDSNWNADNVSLETITELQAMEEYVGENSPGLLSEFGKFMLGGGNK